MDGASEPYWRAGAPERRRTRVGGLAFAADRRRLCVGLVNLMPDAALVATERQFRGLFERALPGRSVEILPFHVPAMTRGVEVRLRLEAAYRPADLVEGSRLDALVVTGAEPRAARLEDEAFWPALARLVDWAERDGLPSLWSCLAAHGAVQRLDGVRRRPVPAKCSGVFACMAAEPGHPLLAGRPERFVSPHSRGSGLKEAELRARGYTILTRSAEAGVDSFTRADGAMLFLQGHPEYEPTSLPLEFRRDLLRYLKGERDAAPAVPYGVFAAGTERRLRRLVVDAERDRRPALIEGWPAAGALELAPQVWREPAARLLGNWLQARCDAQSRPFRAAAPLLPIHAA